MQELGAASITFENAVEHTVTFDIGFQQNRTGTIAKKYTGGTVGIVYNRAHFIGPHHHNPSITATFNQGGTGGQGI